MAATTPLKPPVTSTAGIRKRAGVSVLVLIPVGMAIGMFCDKKWDQALTNAILASLAGLASWMTYHLICRQNNGLIMISMFFAPLINGKTRPIGPFWIFWLILAASFGLMMGAWARWRDGLPAEQVRPGAGGR